MLVVREMNNYDSMTPLQLAVVADSKDFVAHQVCQNVLTVIWYGRLLQDDTYFVPKVHILHVITMAAFGIKHKKTPVWCLLVCLSICLSHLLHMGEAILARVTHYSHITLGKTC